MRSVSGILKKPENSRNPSRIPIAGTLLLNHSEKNSAAQQWSRDAVRQSPERIRTVSPIVMSQEASGTRIWIGTSNPSVPYRRKEGTVTERSMSSDAAREKVIPVNIFAR